MIFTKPWMPVTSLEETTRVPVLDALLRARDGRFVRQTLINWTALLLVAELA